jgi:hypothetical protein
MVRISGTGRMRRGYRPHPRHWQTLAELVGASLADKQCRFENADRAFLRSLGSPVQITNDPNLKARPAWAPDGTMITYARLNSSGMWDIWEASALGGTPRGA